MDKSSSIRFDIGVTIFYCVMIGRFAYFAYLKGPKEIKRLKSENRDTDAAKWQEYIDKCKINIALFVGVGLITFILFFA